MQGEEPPGEELRLFVFGHQKFVIVTFFGIISRAKTWGANRSVAAIMVCN